MTRLDGAMVSVCFIVDAFDLPFCRVLGSNPGHVNLAAFIYFAS
jgi:hypothetical protein